ncbi:hypothetical protein GN956_G20900 [Arapaima gigas]
MGLTQGIVSLAPLAGAWEGRNWLQAGNRNWTSGNLGIDRNLQHLPRVTWTLVRAATHVQFCASTGPHVSPELRLGLPLSPAPPLHPPQVLVLQCKHLGWRMTVGF